MNNHELLEMLKNEMLLTRAKAMGAMEAYKKYTISVAESECTLKRGDKITISFRNKKIDAIFSGIDWYVLFQNSDSGAYIYGTKILKNGKTSAEGITPLCTFDMFKMGLVNKTGE